VFDQVDREKHARLMQTMDRINSKYGPNAVKIATQGSGAKWKLRQEKLSQCYTTRWNDIITVRV
jgi:DNA polymerase V